MAFDMSFYKGKRVFVTGHTGFKGTWLCQMLVNAGAKVTGYSLEPNTKPALYYLTDIEKKINSIIGDVRDLEHLKQAFDETRPEIVFHLAAQALVRESYKNPVGTYETNVMGTVNICECVRESNSVKSFLNVTTDKVYLNKEWVWGYRECEELDGYDPYSNSKSCSELITHAYINSFFSNKKIAASTVRAGNVIGGGDFSEDRIIPDCVRAIINKEAIIIRNPLSIRPYQHVLEPLYAYLLIAAKQYEKKEYAGYYNIGPDEKDCCETEVLVEKFIKAWGSETKIVHINEQSEMHEAKYLKLDCSKVKSVLGWRPRWDLDTAIEKTVEWNKCWNDNKNISVCMIKEINEFLGN